MSNVLNYTQFVLPIQNDGDWYREVQGATSTVRDFYSFLCRTRPYIEDISRQFNITSRVPRDLGYIVGRLWDEADRLPKLADVISDRSRGYADAFVEGMRDHLRERDGLGAPEVSVPSQQIGVPAGLKSKYIDLVARVRKIDGDKAADYMLYEAPKLDSFDWGTQFLDEAFMWDTTPQGFTFWNDIQRQLLSTKAAPVKGVVEDYPASPVAYEVSAQTVTIDSKETTMNPTEIFKIETITYLNGTKVSSLSDDQLIAAISTCEQQIEDLDKVKTKSKAIAAKIDAINGVIAQLVTLLDGDTTEK